jgi:hypothetical protein
MVHPAINILFEVRYSHTLEWTFWTCHFQAKLIFLYMIFLYIFIFILFCRLFVICNYCICLLGTGLANFYNDKLLPQLGHKYRKRP